MSAQDPIVASPVEKAVAKFNATFNYSFRVPIEARDLKAMARLAEARGRKDLADEIENAVRDAEVPA